MRRRSAGQQPFEIAAPTPRFLDDFADAVPNAHLAVAAAQVDADMLHDRSPLPMEAGRFIFLDPSPVERRTPFSRMHTRRHDSRIEEPCSAGSDVKATGRQIAGY
jgi:hypothetical protein